MEWDDSNPIVTFFGDVTFKDIMEANDRIIGDRRFDSMVYQVFDFTHSDHVEFPDGYAKIIARLDSSSSTWNRNVRVATVSPDSKVRDRIEEYNAMMKTSPWKTKTFKAFDEALAWCKLQNNN